MRFLSLPSIFASWETFGEPINAMKRRISMSSLWIRKASNSLEVDNSGTPYPSGTPHWNMSNRSVSVICFFNILVGTSVKNRCKRELRHSKTTTLATYWCLRNDFRLWNSVMSWSNTRSIGSREHCFRSSKSLIDRLLGDHEISESLQDAREQTPKHKEPIRCRRESRKSHPKDHIGLSLSIKKP